MMRRYIYMGALMVGMASLACTDYSEHVAYNEQYPLPEGRSCIDR